MADPKPIVVTDIKQVNRALNVADGYMCDGLKSGPVELIVKRHEPGTGSVPMLRTWRGWMGETAEYMAASGCTMPGYIDSKGNAHGKRPFNADDAHELFTMRWLGSDENGNRYSWKMRDKSGEVTPAPKSKRLYAMDKHLAWATERGIKLTVPRDGEYAKLSKRQEQ